MALSHSESRLPPLIACHVSDEPPRFPRRHLTYPGYTPYHLLQLYGYESSDDSTAAPDSDAAEAPIGQPERNEGPAPEQRATPKAAARASEGLGDSLFSDTDSEVGYCTAVRATRREVAGTAPSQRRPTAKQRRPTAVASTSVMARAPDDPSVPQRSALVDQPVDPLDAKQSRKCRGRKARAVLANMVKESWGTENMDHLTTVMLRNLPVRCKTDGLVHALDTTGFWDTYDFCYMPCDFSSSNSKGYAFVNFRSPAVARCFKRMWHGTERFPDYSDNRALQVTAAHIQGYEANITMAHKTVGIRNPNFRRLVFSKRASPVASESAVPAAPSQSGSAERAVPQGPKQRPLGMLSECADARPQSSAKDPFVQEQPAPGVGPAANWPVDLGQQASRAPLATCIPGRPRGDTAARLEPQAFLGLATAHRPHIAR